MIAPFCFALSGPAPAKAGLSPKLKKIGVSTGNFLKAAVFYGNKPIRQTP
jgi:hypothetical protein